MESLEGLTPEKARNITFVLTDIDDTLTLHGKLPPQAYTALWDLKRSGIEVIPVTGRPAGWCDMIARFWPVAGVIGENGAFAYYLEDSRMMRFYHPEADHENTRARLEALRESVLDAVPGSRIAEDQFARLFDLAIDYREQPPFLDMAGAEAIKEACEAKGARAKISSIHVNAWFGDYDKLSMTRIFFESRYPSCDLYGEVLFAGDSPNDEPMFAFFPLSCGVGNVVPFLDSMKAKPAFLTRGEGGMGFSELAARIISLRT